MPNPDNDWLGGSITALATPFRDDRLDETALAVMAERQIERGTRALVVAGSTGEAAMLSLSEFARAVRVVAALADGRVKVIVGCTAMATDQSSRLAVAAARNGADALLLAAPPYVKPTQAGIIAHTRAVARAADLPVVLYDVPSRTGVAIADATVAELNAHGEVIGLKDATSDLSRPDRLRALCGSELRQLTGEDAQAAAYLARGGHGCISVTANLVPATCAELHRSWAHNELAQICDLINTLAPLHSALFHESNPIPLKAALAMLGLCAESVRAPLTPASDATRARLRLLIPAAMAVEQSIIQQRRERGSPAPALRLVG